MILQGVKMGVEGTPRTKLKDRSKRTITIPPELIQINSVIEDKMQKKDGCTVMNDLLLRKFIKGNKQIRHFSFKMKTNKFFSSKLFLPIIQKGNLC